MPNPMRPTTRVSIRARRMLVAFTVAAAVSIGLESTTGTDRGSVHAQGSTGPCDVNLGRSYPSIEGPWSAGWGDVVTVEVALTVDCRGAQPPIEYVEVQEPLPAGIDFIDSVDVTPTRVTESGPTWRLPVPRGQQGIVDDIVEAFIIYRIRVRPESLPITDRGELRVEWQPTVHAIRDAVASELTVRRQMALPVRVVQPDGGCTVDIARRYTPKPVAAGAPLSVTLRLIPTGCTSRGTMPRLAGMVAIQPARTADLVTRTVTTVRAFIEDIGDQGEYGAVLNARTDPVSRPPSGDLEYVLSILRDAPPERSGGDARTALAEALERLYDPPLHHQVIYLISHGDAPRSSPDRVADLLADADRRGIEVVPICVGGGCDPALAWQYRPTSLRDLYFDIRRGLPDDHRGDPFQLDAITLEETLPAGTTFIPGSIRGAGTASVQMDAQAGVLTIRDVPLRGSQPTELTYRIDAPREGGARFTGRGVARLRYSSGAETIRSAPIRLPRAPVVVDGPTDVDGIEPCTPQPTKDTYQPSVLLGDTADLELEFLATCPDLLRDSDVLLALDVSGSMDAQKLTDVQIAARTLLNRAASPRLNVGLLTFNQRIQTRLPLSGNYGAVLFSIDALGFPLGRGQGSTDVGRVLRAARTELQHRRTVAEAFVVLMSDGRSDAAEMLAAARALEADGVTVVTVCFGGDCPPHLAQTASDPGLYYEVLTAEALDELFEELGLRFRQLRVTRAEIVDVLPSNMPLVPGSVAPAATVSQNGSRLEWNFAPDALEFRTELTYRIEPQELGTHPTNDWAEARFVDELGRAGTALFPVPEISVYPREGGGPCTPELQREGPSGPVVLDSLVTTTLRAALRCPPRQPRLDVVLAIDHSDSMRVGGRLDGAKEAADRFLEEVAPDETQVGLVTFSGEVTGRIPLTADFDRIRNALAGLRPGGQTAITRALLAAEDLLAARRPGSAPIVVLLTDGKEAAGATGRMVEVADEMKAAGIQLVTVCAGECDPELALVASGPDSAFDVADAGALQTLFAQLAQRFSTPSPEAVRVIDAYPRAMRMVEPAFAPPPDVFQPGQATWSVGRMPELGVMVRAAGRPQRPGPQRFSRFARIEYTYGYPPVRGWGYFPDVVLDVITPTPSPTASVTPTTDPRTGTPGPTSTGTTPAATSATPTPTVDEDTLYLPWVLRAVPATP